MKTKDYRLCFVNRKETVIQGITSYIYYLYFTPDITKETGFGWEETPASLNAKEPYGKNGLVLLEVCTFNFRSGGEEYFYDKLYIYDYFSVLTTIKNDMEVLFSYSTHREILIGDTLDKVKDCLKGIKFIERKV